MEASLTAIRALKDGHVNWRGIAHAFYKILARSGPIYPSTRHARLESIYRLFMRPTSCPLIAAMGCPILAHSPGAQKWDNWGRSYHL